MKKIAMALLLALVLVPASMGRDAPFRGGVLLCKPTSSSIQLNLWPTAPVHLRLSVASGRGPLIVEEASYPANRPANLYAGDLQAATHYFYAVFYEDAEGWHLLAQNDFWTARDKGDEFTFTVTTDEHLYNYLHPLDKDALDLYQVAIGNIVADDPDLHFSLGDFAMTEPYHSLPYITSFEEGVERYMLQRDFIWPITQECPFFLVLGNHEGEQGWYGMGPDSILTWSLRARRAAIPPPFPGPFYSGSEEVHPLIGLKGNYWAFEWGDALFVAIDPYANTMVKPHYFPLGDPTPFSLDGWDWSLGKDQYDWLFETVTESNARWKFVMCHHLTSTTTTGIYPYYGRGGAEVADWALSGRPTFEWGGEEADGSNGYPAHRPGWDHGPVHAFLAAAGVTAVLHGHDHFFGYQELDGVSYIEGPKPCDPNYALPGNIKTGGGYEFGDFLPCSGHLRFRVGPAECRMDYVRAWLPGEGVNGEVSYEKIWN